MPGQGDAARSRDLELLGVRRFSGAAHGCALSWPTASRASCHAERLRHGRGSRLIAVMETYQQQGGSIAVPDVLQPYMGGLKVISRSPTTSVRRWRCIATSTGSAGNGQSPDTDCKPSIKSTAANSTSTSRICGTRGLTESLREEKWFNADDFAKGLAMARKRYPGSPRAPGRPPPTPVATRLQATGIIPPPPAAIAG